MKEEKKTLEYKLSILKGIGVLTPMYKNLQYTT